MSWVSALKWYWIKPERTIFPWLRSECQVLLIHWSLIFTRDTWDWLSTAVFFPLNLPVILLRVISGITNFNQAHYWSHIDHLVTAPIDRLLGPSIPVDIWPENTPSNCIKQKKPTYRNSPHFKHHDMSSDLKTPSLIKHVGTYITGDSLC